MMAAETNYLDEKKDDDENITPSTVDSSKAKEEHEPGKKKGPLDNNIYSTKKTIAQGMMDLALLTANASQLKMVLRQNSDSSSPLYVLHVVCLSISIFLQVVVGILLIMISRYNINKPSHHSRADLLNNLSVIGILLITMVNVLASSFGDYV